MPGTPIRVSLESDAQAVGATLHNQGAPIADAALERIFEYGVSESPDSAAHGQRGQGLFVARTYMAKMGGTIAAHNTDTGVAFTLTLPRLAA